ncbi:hypothetical protein N431DRAFT_462908 [Stipitochalara longipes BDJ]|nr:hypothetical protein N431DRAFT_462908 [Stipitochalara longipes BDJ]
MRKTQVKITDYISLVLSPTWPFASSSQVEEVLAEYDVKRLSIARAAGFLYGVSTLFCTGPRIAERKYKMKGIMRGFKSPKLLEVAAQAAPLNINLGFIPRSVTSVQARPYALIDLEGLDYVMDQSKKQPYDIRTLPQQYVFWDSYIIDAFELGMTADPVLPGSQDAEANRILILQGVADYLSMVSSHAWTFKKSQDVQDALAEYDIKHLAVAAVIGSMYGFSTLLCTGPGWRENLSMLMPAELFNWMPTIYSNHLRIDGKLAHMYAGRTSADTKRRGALGGRVHEHERKTATDSVVLWHHEVSQYCNTGSNFAVLATYPGAHPGFFEWMEAFFIPAFGLWESLLFLELTSYIRLPVVASRKVESIPFFGLNSHPGLCENTKASSDKVYKSQQMILARPQDAYRLALWGESHCIGDRKQISIFDRMRVSLKAAQVKRYNLDRFLEVHLQISLSVGRHPHPWFDVPGNTKTEFEIFGLLLTLPNLKQLWLVCPRQGKPRAEQLANWTRIATTVCELYSLFTIEQGSV